MTPGVAPPPPSRGMVSASTLEMDVEPSTAAATRPGGPLDPLRRSLNDVTAARLRRYHQQCNARLDTTLRLFRERQHNERLERSRVTHSRSRSRSSSDNASMVRSDRQWKFVRESSDIRVFRQRHRRKSRGSGASSSASTVLARGSVHGALGDVMNGLYADSTRTARVLELLLSPRSLDARVLQVDKRSSDARPFQFAGITWSALKMPGLGVCKNRDFLCFKKMDTFKDEFGDELGFLVLHSIEPLADELPVGAQSHSTHSGGLVRGFMSLAVLFQRDGDDRVTLFAHGQFDPRGRVPPLLGDACVAEWLTSLANTVQSGQAKNLSLLLASRRPLASPVARQGARRRCGVCARSLYFWDAPRCCRGCWTPCCRTCRVTKPIFCAHQHGGSGSTTTAGPCTETFCLACVCAVIPSGATMNARLLKRLAKKRKRAPPGVFRPALSAASSATDGSVAPLRATPEPSERERRLLLAEMSSISVLSSRESEKYQQHRLSLNARPKKRMYLQPEQTTEQPPRAESEAEMLEVLEHTQIRRGEPERRANAAFSCVSGVSSSNADASLRSFTSADLAPPSVQPVGSFRLGRRPSGSTRGPWNTLEQRRARVPVARSGLPAGAPRGESCRLPRDKKSDSEPRDDEYYQRLLQSYLLSATSSRSLASALSFSSYGDKPTLVPRSRASNANLNASSASTLVLEPQAEPAPRGGASVCSSTGGSTLSAELGIHPRL